MMEWPEQSLSAQAGTPQGGAVPVSSQSSVHLHLIALLSVLIASALGTAHAEQATSLASSKSALILSGCEVDYPPYCFVRKHGQVDGFSVELLRAALKTMGKEVSFETGLWSRIKQDLAEGRIQVLPLVGRTPEREGVFDFTFPYLTMHGTIVVREDDAEIRSPADLKGKEVAVLKGDNAEEYLRRASLGAVIVPRASFETALTELSSGKHDAVVIQKLVAFQIIQQRGIKNLRVAGSPLKQFTQDFCFAVRKGDKDLLGTLNEGLSIVIADGTFRKLHAKWFAPLEVQGTARSAIVVGGDSNYPPYEFLTKSGQPTGFNVEITRAVAQRNGMKVDFRLGPWGEVRRRLKDGSIDIVQGMFYSIERAEVFSFSPPYMLVEHSIIRRSGSRDPPDVKALAGKSVLVMAGDIMQDLAEQNGFGKQLLF